MSKDDRVQRETVSEEELFEEVAKYYENVELDTDNVTVVQKTDEKFSFGFDIDDCLSEEILESNNDGPLNNVIFYLALILFMLCTVATAYRLGININISEEKVTYFVDEIRQNDERYNTAVKEQEKLNKEIARLTGEALEAKERKGTIETFEQTKKKLEEKLNSLQTQEKALNDSLYTKRQEIKEAQGEGNGEYTIKLNPGLYTVGKNIPKGMYDVTGLGSIIASTDVKEMKVNEQLNETKATSVKLENGYTVKINKYTTFKLSRED